MWKKTDGDEPQTFNAAQPQQAAAAPVRNPSPKSQERALIGPSIFIKGELMGEEDLLIEGRVEGKIEFRQNSITVGKSGRVKADIFGKMVSVEGDVQGNLCGEEQLVLRQTANVRGNITAPRVSLEDGCHFKGSIDMAPKEVPEARPAKTAEPDPLFYKSPKLEKVVEPVKVVVPGTESDRAASRK